MKPKLLIIDDDDDIRSQMKWALVKDYEIHLAHDRETALATFKNIRPPVVTLDLGLPPHPATAVEGFATLSGLRSVDRLTKVIVITGQVDAANGRQAVGDGAYDFLAKPVDMDLLKIILHRAYYLADLERTNQELNQRLAAGQFAGMLGNGPPMQQVFSTIRKVATTDAEVLILGESGTGKEMAAQAIHRYSLRRDGPFVAINCSAIPEALLESELFGHEKGSFTGAHTQRQGRLEMAVGGTLFLDEIGELPLPLQVKLLRFLQDKHLERVGGRESFHIDVRVIAATNVNLEAAVQAGRFREDLFYRLAVVKIDLPPLRERGDDLALLAQAFVSKYAALNQRDGLKIAHEAMRAISQHSWPGNVRELENKIKRAVIMAEGNRISPVDLELAGGDLHEPAGNLKRAVQQLETQMITKALRRHKGKVAPAAAELGVSRPTLYEMMEKYGVGREPTDS